MGWFWLHHQQQQRGLPSSNSCLSTELRISEATTALLTCSKQLLVHLQHHGDADVVLGHHSVQHGLRALRVGHGHLVELHRVLLHQREPGNGERSPVTTPGQCRHLRTSPVCSHMLPLSSKPPQLALGTTRESCVFLFGSSENSERQLRLWETSILITGSCSEVLV